MPELDLRQSGLTYSNCGPFNKRRKWIQKNRETGNLKHIYKNELDKASFAHDETYSKSLRYCVPFMLAWVVWVACLRGWRAIVGRVGCVLAGVSC